ncbi:MAG TPA: FAD binding domain-containing protein [Lacipirellulaceae bacterium]|nr:FAD binding domain-containing protein [Lacipirellulaceae bacterium]
MRDHLVLYVNGARQVVRAPDAFLSLSDFLRRRLGLIGTKIVCSEGDCGACSVLVGRPARDDMPTGAPRRSSPAPHRAATFKYVPVDSCIQYLFQLDGAHVVTVEGLRPDGALNAVQQAMIDCHGSQCGFCTPGFVMAMTGALENCHAAPAAAPLTNGHAAPLPHQEIDWRRSLTGNLCRCTGYTPILDAAIEATQARPQPLGELYPAEPMLADLAPRAAEPIDVAHRSAVGVSCRVASPTTLAGALAFLAANPDARIIAGGTDVAVRANKSGRLPPVLLDLNRVDELDFVRVADGVLTCGARATWTSLLAACRSACPEFARILEVFGAPQIRHVGTIGGNIANASPIADSLPLLYVAGATLTLASSAGRREAPITEFYRGYKLLDLQPGELIAEVRIPLPAADEKLRLYKVSRRKDLDISTFTAAIRLRLDASLVESAAIAFGGVGPTVLRAHRTEAYLVGRPFAEATFQAAAQIAATEVTPITDVRGEADYRRRLTENILLKFYYQALEPQLAAS